jgi:hypothetical protein
VSATIPKQTNAQATDIRIESPDSMGTRPQIAAALLAECVLR